jgi:hypothetical protein
LGRVQARSRPAEGRPELKAAVEDGSGTDEPDVIRQTAFMTENVLSVPAYSSQTGVIAPAEGGTVTIEIRDGSVEIFGHPAGLRDLAVGA